MKRYTIIEHDLGLTTGSLTLPELNRRLASVISDTISMMVNRRVVIIMDGTWSLCVICDDTKEAIAVAASLNQFRLEVDEQKRCRAEINERYDRMVEKLKSKDLSFYPNSDFAYSAMLHQIEIQRKMELDKINE